MKQKSSLNESLSLAFEILKRIPRSRFISAKELQAQLAEAGIERNIRSLQRILQSLSETLNLERDTRSKPYGYKLKNTNLGFALPNLSEHESLLLGLSQQYLSHLLPANVSASLSGFFQQAQYNLHSDESPANAKAWLKKVRVVSETQPLLAPEIDLTVMQAVSKGLFENRWLNLQFNNRKGEQKRANVMPLGIAQQGNRLYLVCRFEGHNNERSIAIHRIQQAHLSSFSFEPPAEFDLAKYDNDGRFGFGEGKQCRLQFCINKAQGYFLYETPLSKDQVIEEQAEQLSVSATVTDSLFLHRWLKGFGDEISNIKTEIVEL